MKYKQLSKEQFEELYEEFAKFLATQQIDAKEWELAKKENSKLVEEELNLFSDMVWEKVLQKSSYLEHFSELNINLFKCDGEKMYRIVVQVEKANFNFYNNDDYQWFIDNTDDDTIEFLKGEKEYTMERNLEIFDLIQKGAVISDGKLFDSLLKLIT